jgi:hypothetical protein
VVVRWDEDFSDDLLISLCPSFECLDAYVSGTVVGWYIECLDIVVVNLDSGLVDAYRSVLITTGVKDIPSRRGTLDLSIVT